MQCEAFLRGGRLAGCTDLGRRCTGVAPVVRPGLRHRIEPEAAPARV